MHKKLAVLISLACTSIAVSSAPQVTDFIAPELTSKVVDKKSVVAKKYMVSAANPLAVKAGYKILKDGGNAVDALVAVQTILGLVEPQSSGLGGGGFLVYFDAKDKKLTTFDFRETAPLAATPELFQDEQGNPLKFYDAVVGGRSVGTPGTVKLLDTVHQKYGNKDWSKLLNPAIKLASNGFNVSERLASAIANDKERLARYPETKAYFFTAKGDPLQEGTLLKNKAYADTLTLLAKEGSDGFYFGEIAKDIVKKVNGIEDNPGVLGLKDFENYRVIERHPVCAPYHQYDVCGMGPPSSGALTVGQILGISSHFDLKSMGPNDPTSWQIIGDASRLAFADRGRYMADTDFVPMPKGLLDKDYLASRAALITKGKALENVSAGSPPWDGKIALADDIAIEFPSTSHITIVDKSGNIISMTTTVENGFGSRVMSNGFLLNNELTDFSFASAKNGNPIANRVEPGKRPRISMPHLVNRFGTFDLEAGTKAEKFKAPLEAMGFKVSIRDLNSGIHGIILTDGKLTGGADPRREGIVLGE